MVTLSYFSRIPTRSDPLRFRHGNWTKSPFLNFFQPVSNPKFSSPLFYSRGIYFPSYQIENSDRFFRSKRLRIDKEYLFTSKARDIFGNKRCSQRALTGYVSATPMAFPARARWDYDRTWTIAKGEIRPSMDYSSFIEEAVADSFRLSHIAVRGGSFMPEFGAVSYGFDSLMISSSHSASVVGTFPYAGIIRYVKGLWIQVNLCRVYMSGEDRMTSIYPQIFLWQELPVPASQDNRPEGWYGSIPGINTPEGFAIPEWAYADPRALPFLRLLDAFMRNTLRSTYGRCTRSPSHEIVSCYSSPNFATDSFWPHALAALDGFLHDGFVLDTLVSMSRPFDPLFRVMYSDCFVYNAPDIADLADIHSQVLFDLNLQFSSALELFHRDALNRAILEHNVSEIGLEATSNTRDFDSNLIAYIRDLASVGDTIRGLYSFLTAPSVNSAASAWLSSRYGDRLTVSDSRELYDSVVSLLDRLRQSNPGKCFKVGHSRRYYAYDGVSASTHYTVYYAEKNIFGVVGRSIRTLMNWDAWPTLENTWDLIPLSFVVDWFVSVSDVLNAWDEAVRMLYYEFISGIETYRASRPVTFNAALVSNYRICGSELSFKFYLRQIEHELKYDLFPVSASLPSTKNIVDAFSLLVGFDVF